METAINLITMVLTVGTISFGGGWSVIGIIQDRLVSGGWLTVEGFAKILTISQLVPGPVALNSATLVGLAQGGIVLAVAAAFALVLPGIIIIVVGRWVLKKNILNPKSLIKALGLASLALLSFTLYRLAHNPLMEWWMIPIALGTALLNLRSRLPALFIVLFGLGLGIVFTIFL